MTGTSRNTPDSSSLPVQVPDAPVISRLRTVLGYMSQMGHQMAAANGGSNAKMGLFNKIISEMLKEITEFPPALTELYLKQFAGLVFWTATGEVLDGVEMPPGFEAEVPAALPSGNGVE